MVTCNSQNEKTDRKRILFEFGKRFNSVQNLQLLKGIDIEDERWENSEIMIKLASQLTKYVTDGDVEEAIDFMKVVEQAFENANETVTNYLRTGFLVTLMEQKKEPREYLKSIMGTETKKMYKNLFAFYRELED